MLECEIRAVEKFENSNATWCAKLVDPGTRNCDFSALTWLLHQKYLPLIPNPSETLKRSSSRGLVHTLARSRSIRNYTGAPIFTPGRNLKICHPRVHRQWTRTGATPSLLPNESTLILLESMAETSHWDECSPTFVESHKISSNAPVSASFKAYVLSTPTQSFDVTSASDYVRTHPVKGSQTPEIDAEIVLGDKSLRPVAVLRLSSASRIISNCLQEGDLLCITDASLQSHSREFWLQRKGLVSDFTKSPEMRAQLPLFEYKPETVLLVLPKKTLEKEGESLDSPGDAKNANFSVSSSSSTCIPQDCRFQGQKQTPSMLKPNCNHVTLIGYITKIVPRQKPKNGFHRYGLRLQCTESSSDTCDVTVWDDENAKQCLLATLRVGHLVAIFGVWTVQSSEVVLANVDHETGSIKNLSALEGILACHPDLSSDVCDDSNFEKLATSLSHLNAQSQMPNENFGPFIFLECIISPSSMTIGASLHHNCCKRSVGIKSLFAEKLGSKCDSNSEDILCKFCNHIIRNWRLECNWQYDAEWNVSNLKTDSHLTALTAPEVSEKLLGVAAKDFVLLSDVEKDSLVLHRTTFPGKGKVSISRSPEGLLHLDQFIPSN